MSTNTVINKLKNGTLTFVMGSENFTPEEFKKSIGPFFESLDRVGRTNFLFVALHGDGSKPSVTGYRTDTTINATINAHVTKCERTGGKWAVYRLTND